MSSQPLTEARATVDAPRRADLLDDYRPGAFLFASPDGSLLAEGIHAHVTAVGSPSGLAARVDAALRSAKAAGIADPIVVGALPFRRDAPAHLVVPRSVRRGPALAAAPVPAASADWSIRAVPAAADYERAVEELLRRIDAGTLEKAVLARTLLLTGRERVDPALVLTRLARRDPHAYAFAVDLPTDGERRTLVGASPELLVAHTGSIVQSRPLAGSAARDADPEVDRQRAARLDASGKDRHEHAFVVTAVARALAPFCDPLAVPSRPELLSTPTMWHLATRITGPLRTPASALELAAVLHPTPAVCGVPDELARRAIDELEPFDRGYYAGAVGWCDAHGDGEWAVAIRCAEIAGTSMRLFAGAGIVAGSRPAAELAETAAKFRTLLTAVGADDPQTREVPS